MFQALYSSISVHSETDLLFFKLVATSGSCCEFFLENSADIYGDDPVVPVCPSVTHRTAHERARLSFFKGFRTFLHALAVC